VNSDVQRKNSSERWLGGKEVEVDERVFNENEKRVEGLFSHVNY